MEENDLEIVRQWRNNPYFRQFMREYRELSQTHQKNWYNKIVEDDRFEMFVIELDKTAIIGVAGLTYIDWRNRHCDVHFFIGNDNAWIDDYYANHAIKILFDYAFNTLNMNKLWAEVYEIDTKKLNFFCSKLGFAVDASLREHYYFNGQYVTSHILSLLKKEYEIFNP